MRGDYFGERSGSRGEQPGWTARGGWSLAATMTCGSR